MKAKLPAFGLAIVTWTVACSSTPVVDSVEPVAQVYPPPEEPPPPPVPTILSLEALVPRLAPSQSSTIQWLVSPESADITVDPPIQTRGQYPKLGTASPARTTTYTLTASNKSGTTSKSVRIEVLPGIARDLTLNNMICDPVHGTILAVTSSRDATSPDRFLVLNASTGVVERSVAVGKNPREMALSDDGSTAWVGIDGESGFRKVDTATLALGPIHRFERTPGFDAAVASGIVVLAGSTSSIAVAKEPAVDALVMEGVTIYDDGVPRASAIGRGPDMPVKLARSATADVLYGVSPMNHDSLFLLAVDAGGIRVTEEKPSVASRGGDRLAVADGRLYFSQGHIASATDFSPVGKLVLPAPYPGPPGAVFPDTANNTVFASNVGQIAAFRVDTLVARATYRPDFASFGRVVRCGGPSVATIQSGKLLLIPATAFD